MTAVSVRHAAFIDTSTVRAATRWRVLLDLQVDLFFSSEAKFLSRLAAWKAARSVMDVGCGNGSYLSRLRFHFPNKAYAGIDISPQLIAVAAAEHSSAGLRFILGDFFDAPELPPVDFVLMRFIVQHLGDIRAVLARARAILNPGGGLLVVEPCLAKSQNVPETRLFHDLFARFESGRGAAGYARGRLNDVSVIAVGTGDWRIAANEVICVQRQGPFAESPTLRLYRQWIDLCEESGLLSYPFDEVRAEIDAWAWVTEGSSSCVALRAVLFERVEATEH